MPTLQIPRWIPLRKPGTAGKCHLPWRVKHHGHFHNKHSATVLCKNFVTAWAENTIGAAMSFYGCLALAFPENNFNVCVKHKENNTKQTATKRRK